jgi:hypothetical protein
MAGGYEIPVSLSIAGSSGASQDVATPTIFNFGPGDAHGGWFDQQSKTISPATATSATAKNGNAMAATTVPIDGGDTTQQQRSNFQLTPQMIGLAIAGLAVAALVVIYAAKKL